MLVFGGTDSYTNAISDTYQDNFDEGIFTGKGIYDVNVFYTCLDKEIPENKVLSHDLLEGSYLRCALVSDILLMDGYPTSYTSFKTRLHRWIRGDYQILSWLKSNIKNKEGKIKKNPLNLLSKYKMLDNILRSQTEFFSLISIIFLVILNYIYKIRVWPYLVILIISITISSFVDIINRIIFRKDGQKKQHTFEKTITGLMGSVLRAVMCIMTLPDKARMSISAGMKSIYRMTISKKNLLEWTTSEEAENLAKKDLISYYKSMYVNVILGVLGLILVFLNKQELTSIFVFIISILWIIAPIVMYCISKEIKERNMFDELNERDKRYILEIGKRTWNFFKENINEKSNFLPPDNYQENRKEKLALRTSPTNIGLRIAFCNISL
ncbi:MAG: hypothetical protein J6D03_10940 [Clostridia bacterium]|nr:hypothetical protein [Clostridia bacterium]